MPIAEFGIFNKELYLLDNALVQDMFSFMSHRGLCVGSLFNFIFRYREYIERIRPIIDKINIGMFMVILEMFGDIKMCWMNLFRRFGIKLRKFNIFFSNIYMIFDILSL